MSEKSVARRVQQLVQDQLWPSFDEWWSMAGPEDDSTNLDEFFNTADQWIRGAKGLEGPGESFQAGGEGAAWAAGYAYYIRSIQGGVQGGQ